MSAKNLPSIVPLNTYISESWNESSPDGIFLKFLMSSSTFRPISAMTVWNSSTEASAPNFFLGIGSRFGIIDARLEHKSASFRRSTNGLDKENSK